MVEAGYWLNKSKNTFTRNKFLSIENINSVISERNNTGVFLTAYRYNTEKQDEAFLFGDLYFDFDDKLNFENVRQDALRTLSYLKVVFKIAPEDTQIYFSGNKGVHIMVSSEILGIEPDKNLNKIFRLIAENVRQYTQNKTLDLVIYDNKRLFRIPGSRHEATDLYKVPLTFEELQNLTHTEIKTIASKPRSFVYPEYKHNHFANSRYKETMNKYLTESTKQTKIQHKGTLKCTPPCIEHIFKNGADDGNRNNTIAVLASYYKNRGVEMNEAIEKISEWNSELNTPPTQQSELKRSVRSIFTGKASYGCNTLKIVSECNIEKCPLMKKGGKKK